MGIKGTQTDTEIYIWALNRYRQTDVKTGPMTTGIMRFALEGGA